MNIYGIFYLDGSMDCDAILLEEHIYVNKTKAEEERNSMFDAEIAKRKKDFENTCYLRDKFKKELKCGYFGNLVPKITVKELEVK